MKLRRYDDGEMESGISVAEILTGPRRSSLYYVPEGSSTTTPRPFGMNYTDGKGNPVKTMRPEIVARGFTDMRDNPERLYMIDSEKKAITVGPVCLDLFWDSDKVPEDDRHIFEGTVQDIVKELTEQEGYVLSFIDVGEAMSHQD